jgi:hypothetical protein
MNKNCTGNCAELSVVAPAFIADFIPEFAQALVCENPKSSEYEMSILAAIATRRIGDKKSGDEKFGDRIFKNFILKNFILIIVTISTFNFLKVKLTGKEHKYYFQVNLILIM